LLGVERIADYDRMASVAEVDETFGWSAARELVLDAYASFSPEVAGIARRFFDEAGSTPRSPRASGRERSARTPCRRSTRTYCSTGPPVAVTS